MAFSSHSSEKFQRSPFSSSPLAFEFEKKENSKEVRDLKSRFCNLAPKGKKSLFGFLKIMWRKFRIMGKVGHLKCIRLINKFTTISNRDGIGNRRQTFKICFLLK